MRDTGVGIVRQRGHQCIRLGTRDIGERRSQALSRPRVSAVRSCEFSANETHDLLSRSVSPGGEVGEDVRGRHVVTPAGHESDEIRDRTAVAAASTRERGPRAHPRIGMLERVSQSAGRPRRPDLDERVDCAAPSALIG